MMELFKKLTFLFKLKFYLKKKSILTSMVNLDGLSKDELSSINFKKRKEIVKYAYENIPFYKQYYYDFGFNPETLLTEDDWNKIPVITKSHIRDNNNDFKNPNLPSSRFRLSTTGGSTGVPLSVYFDKKASIEILGYRVLNWWGIKPWENQAFIFRKVNRGVKSFINKLLWWPTKRTLLDCSSMSSSDMDNFVLKVNKIKPSFIQGYVGAVYDFAKYVNDNQIKLFKPKAIWVTAAPLTESTRSFIQNALKAPVYDQYGCSEMFWLAAESKNQNGLHVLSDVRHLEFLNDKQLPVINEEIGNVTITDLENKVFPLIKYQNGDKGSFKKAQFASDFPYPLINKIKGRTTDKIITPSGISVDGAYLTTIFDDFPNIVDAFQVIQQKDLSVVVNCILSNNISLNHKGFTKILFKLKENVNNEVSVSFNFVNELIQDRGKLKFIISEVEKL